MSGSPITAFTTLMNTTGPVILTGPEDVINEASKRNYMLSRFLEGEDLTQIIQGGTKIQDHILADDASTFTHYHPNAMFTWTNPQVEENWEINWRYSMDHMAWTEQEVLHQMGDITRMTRAARHHTYKRLKRIKEARMWTSMMNGMEDSLVALPSISGMEASTGKQPYSLLAFNNEETNGLYTDGSTPWTTVQTLNPVNSPYYVPRQVTYDNDDVFDENDNQTGLFNAFDRMRHLLKFKKPPRGKEFFEEHFRRRFIATGLTGILLYEDALRKRGDHIVFVNPQDPAYGEPKYAGYDIEEFDTLESIAAYDDGSSGRATLANAASPGARFYFTNSQYLKMIFHAQRMFHKYPVKDHPNQVGAFRQPVGVWYNLVCRSRQRGLGIIYPQTPAS